MLDEVAPLIMGVGSVYIRSNSILKRGSLVTGGSGIAGPTTYTDNFRLRHGVIADNDMTKVVDTEITAFTGADFANLVERRGNRMKDGITDTILGGFKASSIILPGNYTIDPARDSGRVAEYFGSSAITVTLPPTAPVNTTLTVYQGGTGAVNFATSGSGSIGGGFTKTNGLDSIVSLLVVSNSTGSNAKWVISGNGAA